MADKLTHYELTAEWLDDDHGRAIMLSQSDGSGCNEEATILIDPWQLRLVCEKFGVIASDPQAAKTIATLQRRLMALRDRVDNLAEWMANHRDHDHADLSYETTQLHALQDLACEWCHDFDSDNTATPAEPSASKPPQQPEPVMQGSLL